jgi:hypothetical protein
MTRGQFAVLCAFLGALVVGIFIIAYEANVGLLSGGNSINQHERGILMLVGAGVGLLVGFFASPTPKAGTPTSTPPSAGRGPGEPKF